MSRPFAVMVVDDERISRHTTSQQLRAAGYVTDEAEDARAALALLAKQRWDAIVTDLRMPDMDGLALLRSIKSAHPEVDVILMTAFGTVETAVDAMRAGAFDYLVKPFRFPELELRLRRLRELRASRDELGRLRAIVDETAGGDGIVGRSSSMQRVRERIALFADHAAPVLVTGETGTGKELVARAIHERSARRQSPFVAVASGAIPSELAESQLFGHEKGAFTGAVQRRRGCFEQADGGTLLLDDIDDLPLDVQVKLLRALQEGTIVRVGGETVVHVDVRVIATTKVDLAAKVERGEFRSDLFYRLRGLELHLPPLRERGDDVVLIAQQFLQAAATDARRTPKRLSSEAAAALRSYSWRGNVRELRRVMESAMVLCAGDEISPDHLPDYVVAGPTSHRIFRLDLEHRTRLSLPDLLSEVEDEVIQWAMVQAQGQQGRAAELLGIPRTTLQSKIRKPAKT
ncbi:MAG: sigma-54-dependent Fis family transcriptional regulator [Deltaproteobacteria bacterium]|nr:sigma-54-dependent Fis family transcriptional regulator [Deltaproteobacteria bacterium]